MRKLLLEIKGMQGTQEMPAANSYLETFPLNSLGDIMDLERRLLESGEADNMVRSNVFCELCITVESACIIRHLNDLLERCRIRKELF